MDFGGSFFLSANTDEVLHPNQPAVTGPHAKSEIEVFCNSSLFFICGQHPAQIVFVNMRREELRLVPRCSRIAQHLYRMLTYISESLTFNLTIPSQNLCPQELNQTLLTVSEVLPHGRQLFVSYQDSESRSRQSKTRGMYDKRPLLG